MLAFAILLILSTVYQGCYLRHSIRRGRTLSAVGAGLAILLTLVAAAFLFCYRD